VCDGRCKVTRQGADGATDGDLVQMKKSGSD
jgi:hypothetical protein